MQDLTLIFEKLKNTYCLTLTTTAALNDGYTIDVPVIRGIGSDRRFDLYKEDDCFFVFSMEFFQKSDEDKYSHAHPYDVESAITLINKFMQEKN